MATGTQLENKPVAKPLQSQLGDRLTAGWARLRSVWAGMQPEQRSWTVALALMLTALIGGVLWYMLRPDWRLLYANMDANDMRETGLVLTKAKIPFETTTDGTGILVEASQLNKARLVTAAKGSVKTGRLGFALFDKANWVGSEFDEKVNYQRALEGELEQSIDTISDVQSSRVNIVMPHDSLFKDQDRPAKASVVLKLRDDRLASGEARAIRNLVASAVDQLTPDHVVLVDADSRLQLGPKTAEAKRLAAEEALENKIISTLEPVTGAGNVRASVTLDYDDAATEETQETYDPTKTVTLSMQRTQRTEGAQAVAAGVAGTASNAPNTQAKPVYPKQYTPPESSKSESGTYGASKTVRHTTEGPGQIQRMTAAIVVNDRLVKPASKGKPAVWQHRSPAELLNLAALAKAAVGFDASRGDSLTIEDMAFEDNNAQQQLSTGGQILATAESSPVLVKYVAFLLGIMLILAFGVRPALQRAFSGSQKELGKRGDGKGNAKELAAGTQQAYLKAPEPAEVDPERSKAQEIFEQVSEQLKREPTQSSRLLQSWIHTERQ